MKKLIAICAVITMILVISSVAQATLTLSWQTNPILGYSSGVVPCVDTVGNPDGTDVFVQTGPGATDGLYIPHYSIMEDPFYHVGGYGVYLFNIGETVANGSGINVLSGETYHVVGVYDLMGLSPRSLLSDTFDYTATSPENFVMNWSHISDPADPENGGYAAVYYFTAADVGIWTYTETWTNNADSLDTITSTAHFMVIPEPATIAILSLGALSLIRRKK